MKLESLFTLLEGLAGSHSNSWDFSPFWNVLLAEASTQTESCTAHLHWRLGQKGELAHVTYSPHNCSCVWTPVLSELVDTTMELGTAGTAQTLTGSARSVVVPGISDWYHAVVVFTTCGSCAGLTATATGDLHVSDASEFTKLIGAMSNLLSALQRQQQHLVRHQHLLENANSVASAKDAFLANMSHEIRTPLNGIIGMTRLLMESHMTAEHREYLNVVHACGFQLLDIINDILDYSKMACGRVRLEEQCFDLRECMETSYDVIALKAREKNLDVSYWIDPMVPLLLTGDMKRLRQIIVNLLSNAVKFTQSGQIKTTVTVVDIDDSKNEAADVCGRSPDQSFMETVATAHSAPEFKTLTQSIIFESGRLCTTNASTNSIKSGSGCSGVVKPLLYSLSTSPTRTVNQYNKPRLCVLRFEVQDSGIGIPPDQWESVFNAFTQVDSTLTRGHEGTGLGLPISRQLAELMHGSVCVKQSSPETGTAITFTVKLKHEARDIGSSELPDRYASMLRGKQVLVVDDNATNRMLLCNSLLSWNMKPFVCSSAQEALLYLRSGGQFHMAFIDIRMPHISGVELAEAIKEVSSIPMIALSSIGDAFDDPNNCFIKTLVKPVKASLLFNACVSALQPERNITKSVAIQSDSPKSTLRILVVEDFVHNQTVALKLLKKLGHENVNVANNGEEAVTMVQCDQYDAVLMDLKMPICDGFEATRRIVSMIPDGNVRPYIIAMTAMVLDRDRDRCLEAGMDAYLSKPLSLDELETMFEVIRARRNKTN